MKISDDRLKLSTSFADGRQILSTKFADDCKNRRPKMVAATDAFQIVLFSFDGRVT